MNVQAYGFALTRRERKEILDLVVSWGVITLAFSWRDLVYGDLSSLPAYALAVFLGFLLHEIAHRNVARRLGIHAYYQAWYLGLVMALLVSALTGGRFVIAAPGAVVIEWADLYLASIVAIWGPITNALIALTVYPLMYLGGVVTRYAAVIGSVNALLAFFNALPIPPLDGYKVFTYSMKRWAALFLASILVLALYVYTLF